MVTPAAKREAVAHLRSAFEVSERRACSTLATDRTSVRFAVPDLMMKLYELVCANWLHAAAASAIGASMFF